MFNGKQTHQYEIYIKPKQKKNLEKVMQQF